jgi:Flp pilus assembly protein TadG
MTAALRGLRRRVRLLRRDPDRGSAPMEMAIVGGILILLWGVFTLAGRVSLASSTTADVAAAAARDASIARTADQATVLANASALRTLSQQGLHCQGGPTVLVDTSGFAAPPGMPANVRVDVTCVISAVDLRMPGLNGARVIHDHGVSPIDPFRSTR